MPLQSELLLRKSVGRAAGFSPKYLSILPYPGAEYSYDELMIQPRRYLDEMGYIEYADGRFRRNDCEPLRTYMPVQEGTDIIGLGLGAVSVLDGVKCTNTKVLSEYIAHSDDPEAIVKLG